MSQCCILAPRKRKQEVIQSEFLESETENEDKYKKLKSTHEQTKLE